MGLTEAYPTKGFVLHVYRGKNLRRWGVVNGKSTGSGNGTTFLGQDLQSRCMTHCTPPSGAGNLGSEARVKGKGDSGAKI